MRRSLSAALRIRRRCRRGKGALGFGEIAGFRPVKVAEMDGEEIRCEPR